MGFQGGFNQKMFKRILSLLAFLSVISIIPSFGQQPTNVEPGPAELKDLIRRAGIRTTEYRAGFKDLTAAEEQLVEEYDQKGKLTKQRRIASDLIIYQSQLDPSTMFEYRDVKAVDGKPIKKREARLISLLNKSAKAKTLDKELDRVVRESQRYDLSHSFHGMTLNQGLPLDDKVRDSFEFKFAGRERVNGHDSIVLEYQQVSHTPGLIFDFKEFPSPLNRAEGRYRGRLWLDAETAQLRREVRELVLQLPSLSRPLVLNRFDFDYVDSSFGVLTPQRIVMTTNSRGRTGADKNPELLLGGKITFEYGAFSRFAVETPNAAIDPPAKP